MRVFDGRHKWGDATWHTGQARYSRTCRVCGRTDTAEAIVPESFVDAMIENYMKPNLYRALQRATFG